jgi:enoyl-CoA hydratase
MTSYETILYATEGPRGTLTLNRPEALNTIVPPMPDEVEDAVTVATRDPEIKVIVVRGAGRAFCAWVTTRHRYLHGSKHPSRRVGVR